MEPQKRTSKWLIGIGIVFIGLIIGLSLNVFVPYSFNHFRYIKAVQLSSWVKAAESASSPEDSYRLICKTNGASRCYRCEMALVSDGLTYATILCYDHENFRGKGALGATKDAKVLWIDKAGKVALVYNPVKVKGTR